MPKELFEEEVEHIATFIRRYYKEEVQQLANNYPTQKELRIDYYDIEKYSVDLADDLTEQPGVWVPAFSKAVRMVDLPVPYTLDDVKVRIVNARPNKSINQLRSEDIGKYLSVTSLVEEVTQVKPEIVKAVWECQRCGADMETHRAGDTINEPYECQSCERQGPFKIKESASTVRDKQLIKLQPLPEEAGGNTTDDIPVMAYHDLAGEVSPGDRLRVNGVLKMDTDNILNESNPDAMRDLYIKANGFEKEQESFEELDPERKDEILELSERNDLFTLFRQSFAPHILTEGYGDTIKLAIILQLFGGVRRELPSGATRKGDINVLMVGEPGTGKSQFLNQAKEIAPKGVKASGKGATAAGLTATAEKSELTGSWTLKAGALVQANKGFAAIDEFDKMNDGARKSMHEALEDQEIPINKAGMNVTLPAQCSVLGAANPKYGHFDRHEALMDQIELGSPLISRFDLIFGFSDEVDEEKDRAKAKHQLKSGGDELEPAIDVELLREYIAYARQNIKPTWDTENVMDHVADYYVDIRQEATRHSDNAPGARMNDALRRYSEASAKARLSPVVERQDVERATQLMDFHIGQIALDENGNINADHMEGMPSVEEQKQEEYEQVKPQILEAIGDTEMFADEIARELNESEDRIRDYLEQMKKRGEVVDRSGKFSKE